MEIKYPKSGIKFFFKLNPIVPVLGLSNDILCTLVAQETAKLPNVKVEGLKKNSAAPGSTLTHPRQAEWQKFFPS